MWCEGEVRKVNNTGLPQFLYQHDSKLENAAIPRDSQPIPSRSRALVGGGWGWKAKQQRRRSTGED